jgi:hypothetical protein
VHAQFADNMKPVVLILLWAVPGMVAYHAAGGNWDPREEDFIVRRRQVVDIGAMPMGFILFQEPLERTDWCFLSAWSSVPDRHAA